MLGKLVRSLLGGEASAPRPKLRKEVRLSDILSIPSVPLRAYFEDRYHRGAPEDREVAARQSQAAIAAGLGEDPLPIAIELYLRAPAMYVLNCSENSAHSRPLKYAFDDALEAARVAAMLPLPRCRRPIGFARPIPTSLGLWPVA